MAASKIRKLRHLIANLDGVHFNDETVWLSAETILAAEADDNLRDDMMDMLELACMAKATGAIERVVVAMHRVIAKIVYVHGQNRFSTNARKHIHRNQLPTWIDDIAQHIEFSEDGDYVEDVDSIPASKFILGRTCMLVSVQPM
jgi:hypothetical protein